MISITDCFGFGSSGVETTRDRLSYSISETSLREQIEYFLAAREPEARELYEESRKAMFTTARALLFDPSKMRLMAYRPLDRRILYTQDGFVDWPRPKLKAVWGLEPQERERTSPCSQCPLGPAEARQHGATHCSPIGMPSADAVDMRFRYMTEGRR